MIIDYKVLGGFQAFNAYGKTNLERANSTKTFVNNSEQLNICINDYIIIHRSFRQLLEIKQTNINMLLFC